MCRQNKCLKAAVAAVLVLSSALWCGTASVSAAVPEGMPLLCEEDQYCIIPTRDNGLAIFDCRGNLVKEWRNYEDFYSSAVIDQDTVISYRRDEFREVFSFRTLDVILRFPAEEYLVTAKGKDLLAVSKYTGDMSFYDSSGNLLYQGRGPVSEEEWGLWTGMVRLSAGCMIFSDTEDMAMAVYIGDDGTVRQITAPEILYALRGAYIEPFGDKLYINFYDRDTGFVADLDGVHYLDALKNCVFASTSQNMNFYNSYTWYSRTPDFVMQERDGTCNLYDQELSCIGAVPDDPEDRYFTPETAGGFVAGLAYPELLGRTCDGFIACGEGMYPYTRMNNGCLVYHDDVVAALPVPPDEIPVSFSEAYFLTEREDMAYTNEYGEHPVIRTAYKRSDGSIFIQSADNDQETLLMDLGETGLAIYRYGGPDDYSSTQSLYNNQYDLAFPPGVNTYLRPFSNGYWFTNRGIYTGIIDTDGSWMVRISAWEE